MTREELEEIRAEQIAKKEPTRYPNTYRDFPLDKAKEMLAKGESAVIRLKLPEKEIVFKDLIK
jgi:nondiscriminating glutamyl-tRNA synthetase